MKIIDEKGKLFGKINLIDFLVIMFLFCLVPMLYFGHKILSKKPSSVKDSEEFIDIEARCLLIKLKPETLRLISVGDTEINYAGRIIGEVTSIGESSPYKYLLDVGEEERILKESPDLQQLEVTLKLKANPGAGRGALNYSHPPQELKIDRPFIFTTKEYRVSAIIPKYGVHEDPTLIRVSKDAPLSLKSRKRPEPKPEPKEENRALDLYVTLKDLDEDLLKKISVGDKEVDESGQTLAEILSLGKIENNLLELNLGKGNFVSGEDSAKKQISTKMRLKCLIDYSKDDTQLYFKGQKIEQKTPFEFKTDKYEAIGILAKTFEITPALKEKWVVLRVKFARVNSEIASVIQKGDIEKDSSDRIAATLDSIISNKLSEVLALKEDEFITLSHPFNKDILGSLNVRCVEKEGIYYFKSYPVKMGNSITFSTELYSITGLIVGMELE